jgi:hypothetical protein
MFEWTTWVNANNVQIGQVRSWLSETRLVSVSREIERIENVSASEAVEIYRTWEGQILSKLHQGLVSVVLDIWMSYSDRDLAHEVLRTQWVDHFRAKVAKSDSELRDAALRKKARKDEKRNASRSKSNSTNSNLGHSSRDSRESTGQSNRRASGSRTEFSTASGANYSLQTEMSKAGIRSIEELFDALDLIRNDLRQALTIAGRFDILSNPLVFRVVLTRLLLSSSVALNSRGRTIEDADVQEFKKFLQFAGIHFKSPTESQSATATLNSAVNIISASAKWDGRFDPSGVMTSIEILETVLFNQDLLKGSNLALRNQATHNARSTAAAILVWLAATVDRDSEDACRDSFLGKTFTNFTREEELHQLWVFGREIAAKNRWH